MLILAQYRNFDFVPMGTGLLILGPQGSYYAHICASMSRCVVYQQLSNSYSGLEDMPHLLIAGMGSTGLVLQYRWMDCRDTGYSILCIYKDLEYRRAKQFRQYCGIGIHFSVLGSKMQGSMPSFNQSIASLAAIGECYWIPYHRSSEDRTRI